MSGFSKNSRMSNDLKHDQRERNEHRRKSRSRSPKSHSKRDRSDDGERDCDRDRDNGYRGDLRRSGHRSNQYRRDNDYGDRHNRNKDHDRRNDGRPSWDNNTVKRHAERIQERKLLWSKAKDEPVAEGDESSAANSSTTMSNLNGTPKSLESAWTSRLVAATNDTSQVSKFQRLMGMKNVSEGSDPTSSNSESNKGNKDLEKERKRQDELTAQLDRQYAMARATTHMGRGKGLGFGG